MIGRRLSVGAMTLGLSFGSLTLAACGSSPPTKSSERTDAGDTGGDKTGAGDKGTGGEKADPADGGGEHTCGAGSCGR